jgi:hypothetical protein
LSGDIPKEDVRWGLANTVFAAKIYYMLDILTPSRSNELANFILTFQTAEGEVFDLCLQRMTRRSRWFTAFKDRNYGNLFGQRRKRAEARQAFAALRCLNKKPQYPYPRIPATPRAVSNYIRRLNWENPWGASSHISHLLFFLSNNNLFFPSIYPSSKELIEFVVNETNKYRREDGSWYMKGRDYPPFQKINSAMKILTGFDAAAIQNFSGAESLIDLCLSTENTGNACNNLNIVFVLYYCSEKTDYRKGDIRQFFWDRLATYQRHYWPEHGGFSFYERKSNSMFYGARISEGREEPDIHGTVLLLWGIAMMSRILGINDDLRLRVPFT